MFEYTVTIGQTPPDEVIMRSTKWRPLREALTSLPRDEYLKMDVEAEHSKDLKVVIGRIRSAVYQQANNAGLYEGGYRLRTFVQDVDDTSAVVWVLKTSKTN